MVPRYVAPIPANDKARNSHIVTSASLFIDVSAAADDDVDKMIDFDILFI